MKIFHNFFFECCLMDDIYRLFIGESPLPSCPIQKEDHYRILILDGLLLLYVALISAP